MGIEIEITTGPGHAPSDRLRAALQRVITEYEQTAQPDDDVTGFQLQVGTLGGSARPASTAWRDGCWFHSSKGCGWYQDSDVLGNDWEVSCVWMSF